MILPFVIGLFVGFGFGLLIMALFVAAGNADKELYGD